MKLEVSPSYAANTSTTVPIQLLPMSSLPNPPSSIPNGRQARRVAPPAASRQSRTPLTFPIRVRIRRRGWAHIAPSASACRSASTTPLRKMHRRSLFPCQPLPIMTGPACQRAAMLLTVPSSGRVSLNAAVKPKRHFPRVRTPISSFEAGGWQRDGSLTIHDGRASASRSSNQSSEATLRSRLLVEDAVHRHCLRSLRAAWSGNEFHWSSI